MEVKEIATDKVIPYARNPRRNDAAVAAVAASIREFGFRQPIVVDEDLTVLVGHTRLKAAQSLGLAKVPVHIAKGLTESQRKAYRIADNKLSELAVWDDEMLALELVDLQNASYDLTLTGFGEEEIKKLEAMANATTEGLTDPDDVPDVDTTETRTKLGDIWLLGKHRIMCGDSTVSNDVARLMDGEKAGMMFTDPPYGVNYEGGHFHSGNVNIKRNREKLAADVTAQIYFDFLPVALAYIDGPCYMWFADSKACDVYNAVHDNGCEVHALIIWHKTNAKYAAMNAQYKQRHEPCLYFKPRGSTLRWCGETTEATVWSQDRDGINEFHPTQKPIALAAKALKNHEAATVLDIFCGSGSTLIAAEQLGRTCYGMEISPQYVDVTVKRWEMFTGKTAYKLESNT